MPVLNEMFTLFLCALLGGPPRLAHLGPPIWMDLAIEDERITLTLSGEPRALDLLLGEELDLVGPLNEEGTARARAAFEALFVEQAPLSIAGEPRVGQLAKLEIPNDDYESTGWLIVKADYVVDLASTAKSVGVRWGRYEGAVWQGESFVPLTVLRGRRVAEQTLLYPEEPEYLWHPAPDAEPSTTRSMKALVMEREPDLWVVPVLSIALGLGALALVVLIRPRPKWRSPGLASAFVLLLASAALRETGTVTLRSPLEEVVAQPSPEQARSIFESLHQNLYDAFLAETEDEIYDLLEVSVDASLLDEMYGEIYESLILRDQGGAVCSIESVTHLDGSVRFPEDFAATPEFTVDWSWQVNGVVSHWGHLHRRRNEYEADYTVRFDGRSWKIAGVDVREHRRVDLPDPELSLEASKSSEESEQTE